jgi:hypothetical protein
MVDNLPFPDLLGRVRARDAQATAVLVRRHQPEMEGMVRHWLTKTPWRRLFDPLDICQLVWADFFPRLIVGGDHLELPGHLSQLLRVMARNHLLKEIARLQAIRRGGRITQLAAFTEDAIHDPRPGPSFSGNRTTVWLGPLCPIPSPRKAFRRKIVAAVFGRAANRD